MNGKWDYFLVTVDKPVSPGLPELRCANTDQHSLASTPHGNLDWVGFAVTGPSPCCEIKLGDLFLCNNWECISVVCATIVRWVKRNLKHLQSKREGVRKNPKKLCPFDKPPSDPPPWFALFPRKKIEPFFLLKIASLMAETNFTLGPTSKTNKFPLLFLVIVVN